MMKPFFLLVAIALVCSLAPSSGGVAVAQACASFPSNDCPAPGVSLSAPSYPCYPGQIKGDWNGMLYYVPWQPAYPGIGSTLRSNAWCFNSEAEAQYFQFQRAP
jgi:hypothetical protein